MNRHRYDRYWSDDYATETAVVESARDRRDREESDLEALCDAAQEGDYQ